MAPLLAAAHGTYLAVESKNAQITNIAGTSAGAIVAAILASGKNPEEFRTKFLTLGRKYLPKIALKPKGKLTPSPVYKLGILNRLFSGDSLYDTVAYRNFLHDLFTDPQNPRQNLVDFSRAVASYFPTANLYLQRSNQEKFDPSERIDHAIFKSSALPLVFHTYRDTDGNIDGGLFNNFPIDCLQQAPEFGRRVGITFRKEASREPKCLQEYLLLLASCVTESNVEESASLLPDQDIIFLTTSLGLLDFNKALIFVGDESKPGDAYVAIRDMVKERVLAIIEQETIKLQISSTLSSDISIQQELSFWKDKYARDISNLIKDIQTAHSYVYKARNIKLTKRIIEYRCYNLLDKDIYKRKDLCRITDYVCGIDGPIYAYGTTITSGSGAINPGTPQFYIQDSDGNEQKAQAISMPESYSGQIDSEYSNLMVFLEHPIPLTEKPFQITTTCQTDQVLYDLLSIDKYNEDIICTTCETAESINELFIICEIPKDLKDKVELIRYKPEGFDNFFWIDGRAMVKADFVKLNLSMVDSDFVRIGWIAQSLTRRSGTGFKAMARDKSS